MTRGTAELYLGLAVLGLVVLGVYKLKKAGGAALDALNPVNPGNIAYGAVNSAGAAVSGDSNWTLGGWVYDVTHAPYDPNAAPPAASPPQDTPAPPGNDPYWGVMGSW